MNAVLLFSFPMYVIAHPLFSNESEDDDDDDTDYTPTRQIPEMVVR